jgi:hypothetical protein
VRQATEAGAGPAHARLDTWGKTAIGLAAAAGALAGLVVWLGGGLPWFAGLGAMALLGAVAGTVTYAVQRDRVRREAAFRALCAQHGWTYSTDDDGTSALLRECIPYRRGHGVGVALVLSGTFEGVPLRIIDGRYTTGSGKHQQRHVVSTVALGMPFSTTLTIEAETFAHKVADAFGGEDIDVESDEFSRRFWVQSPDRRTAYDILHPGTIDHLLHVGERMTWHWNGPWLVVSWTGRLSPEACMPGLLTALGFRKLLPRHLLAPAARRS